MKHVTRIPPPSKPVHEFIFTEAEARFILQITGNLTNREIAEKLGISLEVVFREDMNYKIYDALDDAFNEIDNPK